LTKYSVSEYFYNFYLPHYPHFFFNVQESQISAEENISYSFPAANVNYSIRLQLSHHGTHNASGAVLADGRLWQGQIDTACCDGDAVAALADDLCRQLALASAAVAASAVQW
jgi:hypothetical protein